MKWKRSKKTDSSGSKKASADSDANQNDNNNSKGSRSQSSNHSASHQQHPRGERELFSTSPGNKKVAGETKHSAQMGPKSGEGSAGASSSSSSSGWTAVRHLAECGRSLAPSVVLHNAISDKQVQEDPFYRPYVS